MSPGSCSFRRAGGKWAGTEGGTPQQGERMRVWGDCWLVGREGEAGEGRAGGVAEAKGVAVSGWSLEVGREAAEIWRWGEGESADPPAEGRQGGLEEPEEGCRPGTVWDWTGSSTPHRSPQRPAPCCRNSCRSSQVGWDWWVTTHRWAARRLPPAYVDTIRTSGAVVQHVEYARFCKVYPIYP